MTIIRPQKLLWLFIVNNQASLNVKPDKDLIYILTYLFNWFYYFSYWFSIVSKEEPDFQTIVNLKKLKGDDNAYRLRVGDYRIGFYFDGDTVTFARVLHRKDIYRYFPP